MPVLLLGLRDHFILLGRQLWCHLLWGFPGTALPVHKLASLISLIEIMLTSTLSLGLPLGWQHLQP